ncbi:hypothetical protein Ctob_004412 [Chrysochromulina tobinii]|uniref:Uncharacterized protein n=1 Tax=Chrysochromulina tobinii TaxID=1460289 RepID=A0A0M0JNS1_9EUKA|nr:hypothetical protein Ctob_004412 [Chrysochromulina tobinii]|eukprot:KOO28241.1 hypothetical protein Ctob_004412 [Chrysochromulina sp. CCMP291]
METLLALLQPPLIEPHEIEGPFTIDRSSLLGLYVRRIHLAFRETTFEELCTLVTHFGQWVTAANAPEASEEPAVDDAVAAAAPPPWQYLLPASQLEQHVHQLVRLVEEGLSELPAGSLPLKRQVQQLLLLAPNVPQVHYLDLLCHLQDKAYEDALGAFHRYFDKLVFAHKEHALAAIQEAVRSAQQHEDNTDRVLAACKLAVLAFGPKGEEGALQMLVQLRPHCAAPPLFALWRQHTLEVLVRGAVLRGEQRRASEFLALQKKEVAAQHGASDVTWAAELELLIQQGENFQAICKAADLEKTRPLGKAGGLACPRATIKLAMAKAHALGGDPLNAMPHALTAIALAEQASLQSVMRNGSTYQAAQLQALTAHCRLAQLPDFNATTPPQLQPLRTHILPAIRDALNGFVKLRCHNEVAQLLYLRARIWNSLTDVEADALDQRDRDAELFCRAEEEAKRAAMRPSGAVFEYAEPGVLEAHLQRLKELDAEAATLYASAST